MKTVFKFTLSIVMAVLFLMSFTGVRLLIHHCMACESTDYYVFADVSDCCENLSQNHSPHSKDLATCSFEKEEKSCCSDASEDESSCLNCCQDEVIYLKNDYELSRDKQPNRIEPTVFTAVISAAATQDCSMKCYLSQFKIVTYDTPPPALVGKVFVLFAHQLKTHPIS